MARIKPMSRRRLLRGSLHGVGIGIGLPALEAMLNSHGTAYAQGAPFPQRYGVFFWGDGVRMNRWIPTATGPNWPLSPELEPVAPVKDYLNIVTGLRVEGTDIGGSHSGGLAGVTSGWPYIGPKPSRTQGGPTFDQVAAQAIGSATRFRSLETGISRASTVEGTITQAISHRGPNSPNMPVHSPAEVYSRLIAGGIPTVSDPGTIVIDKTVALRRSVLDAITRDMQDLRPRLSLADQKRVDQHLDGVRDLERRLMEIEKVAPSRGPEACKAIPAPLAGARQSREPLAEILQSMTDVLIFALKCDLTRVFTVQFTYCTPYTVFWQVGSTTPQHDLSHNEPGEQPMYDKGVTFAMGQFSAFIDRFKKVTEGAGSMLDNMGVVGITELDQGFEHSTRNMSMIVAGKAGGRLRYPGVHFRAPNAPRATLTPSHVHLTVMRALGMTTVTQVGSGPTQATTVIPEIMA